MNKQVSSPGLKEALQPFTGKNSWFQNASVHFLCTLFTIKTVISATAFPASGFDAHPLTGCHAASCREQNQGGAIAGIAGLGRGQWTESSLSSSISFNRRAGTVLDTGCICCKAH